MSEQTDIERGQGGKTSRATREEGEEAAASRVEWERESGVGHFVEWGGGHKDGMQCSLGAKVKAAVVQMTSVLRTPVTFRRGLLSPDLI